jgi:hypothetical protein
MKVLVAARDGHDDGGALRMSDEGCVGMKVLIPESESTFMVKTLKAAPPALRARKPADSHTCLMPTANA